MAERVETVPLRARRRLTVKESAVALDLLREGFPDRGANLRFDQFAQDYVTLRREVVLRRRIERREVLTILSNGLRDVNGSPGWSGNGEHPQTLSAGSFQHSDESDPRCRRLPVCLTYE